VQRIAVILGGFNILLLLLIIEFQNLSLLINYKSSFCQNNNTTVLSLPSGTASQKEKKDVRKLTRNYGRSTMLLLIRMPLLRLFKIALASMNHSNEFIHDSMREDRSQKDLQV